MSDRTERVEVKAAEWYSVDVGEWLGLDEAEMEVIDMRVALVVSIRRCREAAGMSQVDLAKRVGTSQPNLAKIEAGGMGVSLDVLMRTYLVTGGTLAELTSYLERRKAAEPVGHRPSPAPKPSSKPKARPRAKAGTGD